MSRYWTYLWPANRVIENDERGATVASVHTGNEADAKLIAAAPELLAALIRLNDRMSVLIESDSEDHGRAADADIAAYSLACDVIAKAGV